MTQPTYCDTTRRQDAVFLIGVQLGNPNGDPDEGNRPRQFADGHGLITDVAIKRRIRDYISLAYADQKGYDIYVQRRDMVALNDLHAQAYDELGLVSTGSKQSPVETNQARAWMCERYWDTRVFGMVMTTGKNCGQVRGPVQVTMAQSTDPIDIKELTITRVSVTKSEDLVKKATEMGRKFIVSSYALYIGHVYFVPHFAKSTGCSSADLARFWEGLQKCWEVDRSASRGDVALRGLHVFSHVHPLGNAPAHQLFDRIKVTWREGIAGPPQTFDEYVVAVDTTDLPDGIAYSSLV